MFKRRKADVEPEAGGAEHLGAEELDVLDGPRGVRTGAAHAGAGGVDGGPAEATAPTGPFDVSQVPDAQGRLDLGALWVEGVDGMELRLEIEPETQRVIGAMVVLGDSAAQLQAFAAPRSSGLWDEIRTELSSAVVGSGGTAQEQTGPWGAELRTRMPTAGPDGRTVFAPARFIGIDGPRWFLRVVVTGSAALNEAVAEPLLDVVRTTVVVRGQTPMAPREVLPLTLPEGAAPQPVPDESPDLDPFTRGPEITQVH